MVTFIISNILCFIVNGVAVVYIGRGIGIYNTAVKKLDEVTNCKSNIREACVCNIDGKAVKFSGGKYKRNQLVIYKFFHALPSCLKKSTSKIFSFIKFYMSKVKPKRPTVSYLADQDSTNSSTKQGLFTIICID